MTNKLPDISLFFKNIEKVSKLALYVAGLTYVLGFLVTSVHFSEYNVSSLNLIRPHYILAGFWLLLPIIVLVTIAGAIILAFGMQFVNLEKSRRSVIKIIWKFGIIIFMGLFGSIMFMGTLLGILAEGSPKLESWVVDSLGPYKYKAFAYIGALTLLTVLIYILFKKLTKDTEGSTITHGRAEVQEKAIHIFLPFLIALFLVTLFSYIGFFSVNIYPRIPSAIGGGKPILVTLYLKPDTTISQVGLNNKVTPSQHNIDVMLRLEQDKMYIISPKDNHEKTIKLSKDLVASVVMHK